MSDLPTITPEGSYAPEKAGEYRFVKTHYDDIQQASVIADECGMVSISIEALIQILALAGFQKVDTIGTD